MSTASRKFNWHDEDAGKAEYDEWLSYVGEHCSTKGVGYCISDLFTDHFKPLAPLAPVGNNASALSEYNKALHNFNVETRKYYRDFVTAAGVVFESLTYRSKPHQEITSIYNTKPTAEPMAEGQVPLPPLSWTPDVALRAVLAHLKKNYSVSDATDAATLRYKLSPLTDSGEGGFSAYAEQFTSLHCALIRADQEPAKTECAEWARNGIKNGIVKVHLASSALWRDGNSPTFQDIFKSVREFLKNLGVDFDPYKSAKTSPISKPLVTGFLARRGVPNGNQQNKELRCTRCWRNGHTWKDCHANSCSACDTSIFKLTYCPQWKEHKEQATRFAPKHLLENGEDRNSKRSKIDSDSNPKIQEAYKSFRAAAKALNAAKKKPTSSDE